MVLILKMFSNERSDESSTDSFCHILESSSDSNGSVCESDSSFEMGFISSSSLSSNTSHSVSSEHFKESHINSVFNTERAVNDTKNNYYQTKIQDTNINQSFSDRTGQVLTNKKNYHLSQNNNDYFFSVKKMYSVVNNSLEFNVASAVCTVCGENFPSSTALDVHKLNHFPSESYSCEICNHICKNKEDYALHFQTHDQSSVIATNTLRKKKKVDVIYACEICGHRFKFLSSYERHMIKHASLFICNICNASFQSQLLCHQHKLKHAKEKTNKCKICDKIFQRPHQLTLHMQVHETEKKYRCTECDFAYSYKTSLMRHVIKYHAPGSTKFQCEVCGELFKTKKMLNCHSILHTSVKLIQCNKCSQTFKYRSSYQRHLSLHRSSKPYRCYNCGKTFQTENILKIHKALHVANDKFVCKICDKSFAFESFLTKHVLLHENKT